MACLKCGRKTAGRQVFCDSCEEAMAASPVKPGTAVLLPSHKTQPAPKKTPRRKRALSAEEQLPLLRRSVKRLYLCIAVLTLVLGMATGLLIHEIRKGDEPIIGQNYTIDTTRQPD